MEKTHNKTSVVQWLSVLQFVKQQMTNVSSEKDFYV